MMGFHHRRPGIITSLLLAGLLSTAGHADTTVPVSIVTATLQPVLREVDVTGTVTSPQVASLSPAAAGLVAKIQAEEGDQVTQGQPLLGLDDELIKHQLAVAKAQVAQADIAAKDARRRLNEAEALGPKGGIAATLIEDIRAEVATNEAALTQRRAEVAQQQTLLDRHQLKAPFAGIVSRRLVDLGEWVTPGQSAFELVATDNLRLDFALAEDFVNQLAPDSAVEFRLNAVPGKTFKGKVSAIVPVADPGARTFLVRITPPQPIAAMKPGLSAVATVRTGADYEALVVPEDAVLRYPDGRIIAWIIEAGDQGQVARERLLTVAPPFDGLVPVLSGLADGDRVVLRGNEALQDGQPVKVVSASQGE